MPAHFKLNYSGLNYLIASSDDCQNRAFLLSLLRHNNFASVSLSQLESICGMEKKQISIMLYAMLKNGWLSSVDEPDDTQPAIYDFDLQKQLYNLSSTGSALLADMDGLIIAATGFSEVNISYLAASATGLLRINEAAKKRNNELCNGTPWALRLQWGKMETMVQLVCIGPLKFALIIDDEPQLNSSAFFQLIAMLAKRYIRA